MKEATPTRRHAHKTIDGVEALVNLDPGELFVDLPINTPRYIRVREGDQIQQGDVRTQPDEMGSQTLSKWRIETITTDTVTGIDSATGESQEWDREWLIQHLGTGGFSVELVEFDRVSVAVTTESSVSNPDDQQDTVRPQIHVNVYGNNGQKFTQLYTTTELDNWESLSVVRENPHVQKFGEELKKKFDAAIAKAIEAEQQYH